MEVDGKNVLAPTDMEIECQNKTALRSVALEQLFDASSPAPQQIVLLDACRNNPFPQCPTRGASGSGFRGLSLVGEADRTLLIANATLSGNLAADGDPGAHSPFASALIKNFNEHPRLYFGDLLNMTAADVRVASRGSQIPEITARGGSPRICLDVEGCGNTGVAISPEGMVTDPGAIADARSMLQQLGYLGDASRGEGEDLLSDAIKRFQEKAGLTADGKLTPTVLAVLRATKVAGPIPGKTGLLPPVAPSATEHEAGSSFKDCETCPDMVSVPAGHFIMGSGKAEKGRQKSEEPQHEVTVPTPLAISKYEVTFDEWEACTLEGGCANYRPQDSGWGRERRPVIYLSTTPSPTSNGSGRRRANPTGLLSEAEWEFAARGGRARLTLPARHWRPRKPISMRAAPQDAGRPNTKARRSRSAPFRPTLTASTTWRGTCSNGSTIAGTRAMPARRQTRRPAAGTAPADWPKAGLGTMKPTSPAPLRA
jgi:peptidoglycan hydrolase-like protein with peptidoglycan-binding domain